MKDNAVIKDMGKTQASHRLILCWLGLIALLAWGAAITLLAAVRIAQTAQSELNYMQWKPSSLSLFVTTLLVILAGLILSLLIYGLNTRPQLTAWLCLLAGVAAGTFFTLWLVRRGWGLNDVFQRLSVRLPIRFESYSFVAFIAVAVLLIPLFLRAIRPRWTMPSLVLIPVSLLIILAVGAKALTDLILLVLFTVACYELGWLLLRWLGCFPKHWLEAVVLGTGLGSGLLALLVLLLGMLKLLTFPLTILMIALPLGSSAIRWAGAFRQRGLAGLVRPYNDWQLGWFETALLGIILGCFLIGYAMGLAPEVMSDAMRVHLAMARLFAEQHEVMAVPTQVWSYFPLHGQLLFTVGMMLHGVITAKLIHTMTGLLVIASVGVIGWRYAGVRAGLIASALTASLPVMTWELGTAYVDLFVTLYGVLMVLCLIHWQEEGGWRWPLLLGGMLGFGVAAKLTMGFISIAVAAAILLVARRGTPLLSRIQALLFVGLGAALTSGPWLARSTVLTGQIPGLSVFFVALTRGGGRAPEVLANLPGFGLGRGLLALIKLPWNITNYSSYFGENGNGFIGFALLLLLPLPILLRPTHKTLALGLMTLISFLLWFYTAQYLRYLLPTLALLAVLLGISYVNFESLLTRVAGKKGRWATITLFELALLYLLLTAPLFYLATIFIYPGGLPVSLVLGQQSPQTYLAWKLPQSVALRELDKMIVLGAPAAALPEALQLYSRATLLSQFNGAPWLLNSATPAELAANFQKHGVTFLLLNRNTIPNNWYGSPILREDFLDKYAEVVSGGSNIYLYRIYPDGSAPTTIPGAELIRNPDFEAAKNSVPSDWTPYGAGVYDASGTKALSGRAAVLSKVNSGYTQAVQVTAGHSYILSCFVRSDEPNAFVRLQINWHDASSHMLTPSIEVLPAGKEYRRHKMFATAPAGASYGVIYVVGYNETPCWFDDYSLKEIPLR